MPTMLCSIDVISFHILPCRDKLKKLETNTLIAQRSRALHAKNEETQAPWYLAPSDTQLYPPKQRRG